MPAKPDSSLVVTSKKAPGYASRLVTLIDKDNGITYRVTINKRGQIDHFELSIHRTEDIRQDMLRRVPIARIRRVATTHLAELMYDANFAASNGKVRQPYVWEVAQMVNRFGLGRSQLVALYHRPIRTIDDWITEARRQGLIEPSTYTKNKAKKGRDGIQEEDF